MAYKIIESPARMSREEIYKTYGGKWIFLTDPQIRLGSFFESAIPVVVADKPFEGSETGIYEKIHDGSGGNSTSLSLLRNQQRVFGFSEVLTDE
jgi:hypothetical protein